MKNDVLINYKLLAKVLQVHEPVVDDDTYQIWKRGFTTQEQITLTKVADMCAGMTEAQIAVAVIYAVKHYPNIVLKAILDELQEGKDGNQRN